MSSRRDRFKPAVRVASLGFVIAISASSSSGQFPPQTTYVCQTATFWCAFQWAPGVPNGTYCYCNTMWDLSADYPSIRQACQTRRSFPSHSVRLQGTPPPDRSPKAGGEVAANDSIRASATVRVRSHRDVSAKLGEVNSVTAGSKHTFNGNLHERSSRRIVVSLDRGVSYKITGTCDDDCDDLDLKLRRGTVGRR